MLMKKNIIATILFGASTTLSAVTMDWNQFVDTASANNPSLMSAKKDWLALQENEDVAFAAYLPSLKAQTSYNRSGSVAGGGNGAGGIVQNGVLLGAGTSGTITNSYLGSLIVTQNLFSGLKDKSKVEQAEWRSKSSFWNYTNVKSNLSYSLKEAFATLAYAQEMVDLTRTILDRRESNYNLVRVRFDNGRENKGSVLLSEAYKEQAALDLIKAKDALNVAQTKFKALMNKDYLDEVHVEGEVPLFPLMQGEADFEKLALETPVYNKAYATEMAANEDISIARAAFMPSLDVTGNVTRSGTSYFPENERWNMAITLTIPLFDGLRDKSTYNAAVMTKTSFEAQKRSALLDLLPKLRDAQNAAKQGDIKYNVDLKFQQAASTRAEIARAKYNNGLLTFEDWDIIEQDLIARQTTFLQSKRDRTIKYATWENTLGKGSIQ